MSVCVGDDAMHKELWRLCASGLLLDVPRPGDIVYYFPQGHIELFQEPEEEGISQGKNQKNPEFNLPSKILCHVIGIDFLAEKDTDELYAYIVLLPHPDQTEPRDLEPIRFEESRQKFYSFCKKLSLSDASALGVCTIPRKHATKCLPQLDMTQENASQQLVAKDIHGVEWKFRHICLGNPQKHWFTTGWGSFLSCKRLVAGDALVFLRGENGQLRVGIRRKQPLQLPTSSSGISIQNIRHGMVTTLSNCLMKNAMVGIYYKPRTGQFVVGLNKYLNAMRYEYTFGMRFKMRREGENSFDRRFCGTIVGIGDASPEWPNSPWRSLKVQWDEPATFERPGRVSCWEIEPFVPSPLNTIQPVTKCKRPRDIEASSSSDDSGSNKNQAVDSDQRQKDNYSNPINPESNKSSEIQSAGPTDASTGDGNRAANAADCWLFGVNLANIASNDPRESSLISNKGKQKQIISDNDLQTKQASIPSLRTRTKVKMHGVSVGRAIDLKNLSGYEELIDELEKLFDIKGELKSKNKWAITFTDDENDMMLVGDDPWPEFCRIVKKIFIGSRKDLLKRL